MERLVSEYLFATKINELQPNNKLLKKTEMTYLKTLHLKIQCGRDDVIQVYIDLIFIMASWGIQRTKADSEHIVPNIISRQKVK